MENESSTKILWTKDYSKFSFLKGNRDLVEGKINKLLNDVKNGLDLFKYCPILVSEDFHIIDGQHRFYASKKLGTNIYYIIVPDFTLAQIAKVNNNQNRWKMIDFLNCYCDAGKNREAYNILRTFSEKWKVSISLSVSLIFNEEPANASKNNSLELFRNGEFTIKHLDYAEKLLQNAKEYEPFFKEWNTRDFLACLHTLYKVGKFDQKAMIDKLILHNLQIEKKYSIKEYLQHIENLLNYRNIKRITIY